MPGVGWMFDGSVAVGKGVALAGGGARVGETITGCRVACAKPDAINPEGWKGVGVAVASGPAVTKKYGE